jgi:hypothetical protein
MIISASRYRKKTCMMLVILLSLFAFSACGVSKSTKNMDEPVEELSEELPGERIVGALPQLIIYRMKHDYQYMVPVTLNQEKTAIESFPGPGDLYYQGELAIPVELSGGYYLDIKGIGPNTAFLKMSYERYSKWTHTPSAEELYGKILDRDPFLEMYACGVRAGKEADRDRAEALVAGGFSGCDRLK